MPAKILIVEDESIVAQDLQFILEDLGYNASEIANSAESVLKKTTQINPDLILMDIGILGTMDGIVTATKILQQFDIPVVYLTAHADEDTVARTKLTSPYGYIIRPFKERELRTTIEIALYKHRQEQKFKKNTQWLKTVLDSIGDGVITTDNQGLVTFLNPAAEKLTGWSLTKAIGKNATEVFKVIDGSTRMTLKDPVAQVLKARKVFQLPQDSILVQQDGQEIYISDSIAPILDNRGIVPLDDSQGIVLGTVIIFRDITEQRLFTQHLHRKAFFDSLTNLPNRDWFRERLIDAIERVKRNPQYLFAVLFLDLDDFKKVNDSLGHSIGDKLLIEVAARLSKAIRSFDTVARLGGDEFAIILESLQSPHESFKVAKRIIHDLSIPGQIDGHEISTNTSIGIVLSSRDRLEIEELIRDADIAMYRAKEKGKGCYEVFDQKIRQQILATSQLERELRIAIAENQFTVYYQPIIALPSQEITGFEALVRWIHPQKGLIAPAKFIPIAEETGLITQIDLWVLQEACRQLKIWQAENIYSSCVTVSVNLSCRHFTQLNCISKIKSILETTNTNPNFIKLEITETILIENTTSAATILAELRALGVTLSLDDFGTGYSSLSYLQQFPLDVLKIDSCFVRNLHQNTKNATIAKALIEIAHQLNLTVVAEGVETGAELAFLSQNKCDTIQGYFFSPPLATTKLEKLEIRKASLH